MGDLWKRLVFKLVMPVIEKYIKDQDELRNQALIIANRLDAVTEATSNPYDDYVTDGLILVLNNDTAWSFLYEELLSLWELIVEQDETVTVDYKTLVPRASDAGISPSVIIIIVQLAIEAFNWWRNRNS